MLQRTRARRTALILALWLAAANGTLAQTAGEGSGSEAVGAGGMIKTPEDAEKGGNKDRDPTKSDQAGQRSDEAISSGSTSPSTAPK